MHRKRCFESVLIMAHRARITCQGFTLLNMLNLDNCTQPKPKGMTNNDRQLCDHCVLFCSSPTEELLLQTNLLKSKTSQQASSFTASSSSACQHRAMFGNFKNHTAQNKSYIVKYCEALHFLGYCFSEKGVCVTALKLLDIINIFKSQLHSSYLCHK